MEITSAGVLCRHLVEPGANLEWVPVRSVCPAAGLECDHDYLCPACAARFADLTAEDLVVIVAVRADRGARVPSPSRN
jgi:hypothetical protein